MSVQLLEAHFSEQYPELRKPIAEIEKSCCNHRLPVFDFDIIKGKICELKSIRPTPKSCDALFFDTEAGEIVLVEMKDLQSAWDRFQSEASTETENTAEKKRREFYADVFDELEFSSLENKLFTVIDNFCNNCRNEYAQSHQSKDTKPDEQEFISRKALPVFSKELYQFYCETKIRTEEKFNDNEQQIRYKENKLNQFIKNKITDFELVTKVVHSLLLLAELGCGIEGFRHTDFWVEKSRAQKIIFVLLVNVNAQVYNRIKSLLDKEIKTACRTTRLTIVLMTPKLFREKWSHLGESDPV